MEAAGPDLSLLAQRISDVQKGEADVRLVVLDSMVPGQKMTMTAPPQLVELFQQRACGRAFVVLGRQGQNLHSHGVEVELESVKLRPVSPVHPEGTADIVLSAVRLCEVLEISEDDGSLWLGRPARVRYIDVSSLDKEAPPEPAVLERSEALAQNVEKWVGLVRKTGGERVASRLEDVMANLGPMPETPSARCLWVAGLINPSIPKLELAEEVREVRPAVLMAKSVELRLRAVEMGIRDSIRRLVDDGDVGV